MKKFLLISFFVLTAIFLLPTIAAAETENSYMISLRGAFTPGNEVFEKYTSAIFDFRYFVSDRFLYSGFEGVPVAP